MAAIRRARITRRHIDRDYSYQVEIVVPEGGLGTRLDEMHAWAMERGLDYQTRSAGRFPVEAMRFCFRDADVAQAFTAEFSGTMVIGCTYAADTSAR